LKFALLALAVLLVSGCTSEPVHPEADEGGLVTLLTITAQIGERDNHSKPNVTLAVFGRDDDLNARRFAGNVRVTLERKDENGTYHTLEEKAVAATPDLFVVHGRPADPYLSINWSRDAFPVNATHRFHVSVVLRQGARFLEASTEFYYYGPPPQMTSASSLSSSGAWDRKWV
jgi:hypothetical protein